MTIMKVDLGREVDYEYLERALGGAAEELGLNMEIEHEFDKKYELDPPLKKTQEYLWTTAYLKKGDSVMFKINIYLRHILDNFSIIHGLLYGSDSEKEIEQYLDVFRTNLNNQLMYNRTKN